MTPPTSYENASRFTLLATCTMAEREGGTVSIQDIVSQRNIHYLLHFTRLENLQSIVQHGLLPRGACAERGIVPVVNDAYRLDYTDAVCLSISFPNYKMFFGQREELRKTDPSVQWAVVAVAPRVMWEKSCAFCRENAANANVTNIPLEQRMGDTAFSMMFSDYNDKTRQVLGIPDTVPTHPQAEVLVFEPIGPEYILGAAFNTAALKDEWNAKGLGKQFLYIPNLFKPRLDYAHWKKVL